MLELVGFGHRQRIHIGPERDHPIARLVAAQRADDAGRGQAAMHLDAELFQLGRDDAGRPVLLKAELRMRVQVAAPGGQIIVEIGDTVGDRHELSPAPARSRPAAPNSWRRPAEARR
ncbi:MAG: hypothetical protein WDN69_06910 [Aliidongia sp.]